MSKKLSRPMKFIGLLVLLGVLLTITITVLATTANVSTANVLIESEQPVAISSGDLSCRFGATPLGSDQAAKLQELGAGWYLNFGTGPSNAAPANSEFVPMIRLKQLKSGDNYLNGYTVNPPLTDTELGKKIDDNQGATWIVGNEPDRGPTDFSSGQDDMMPDMYARAFHDVYEYIKERDPSALVATAGLVEITPGRIQYLDLVANAYYKNYGTNIPADVWTMHLYIMPELTTGGEENSIAAVAVGTNPALGMRQATGSSECGNVNNNVYCFADHDNTAFFQRQIKDLRTWMKEHGQQNKPLIITEYSILYPYDIDGGSCFLQDEFGNCFTPTRVSKYLRNTFDLVDGVGAMKDVNLGFPVDDYRLVQQILWWSINAGNYPGASSNLYNESIISATAVGNAFKAETAERTPTPNLKAWYADNVTGFINPPATTTTVTLSADIYNNGSLTAPGSVIVTFYKDAAMSNVIDFVAIPSVSGCARDSVTASVDWSGLTSGVHQYWVKVDSSGLLVETSESDNVNSGIVIIDPEQVFLPVTTK